VVPFTLEDRSITTDEPEIAQCPKGR